MGKEKKEKEKPEKPGNKKNNVDLIREIEVERDREKKKGFASHLFSRLKEEKLGVFSKGVGGIIDEYRTYKSIKGEVIEKYEAYETVVSGSTDTVEYYVLLILSCLIATMGLYLNSAAVIIGAMIVAPLMGPLFGFSAGMLWGSGRVIKEAITTLFKGTALVIGVTALMSFLIPGIIVTGEMAARSQPTLFDIMIAICCGLIGAYAYINKRVSSAIPGVAISVALMPPLCTVGIGIGLRNVEIARGAALLYGINLTGISLSATIIFFLVRLHPKAHDEKEFSKAKVRAIGQVLISFIIILLICIPLVFFMITTFTRNYEKDIIYSQVYQYLPGDRIYSIKIEDGKKMEIELILLHRAGMPDINPGEIEKSISSALNKEIELDLYYISECIVPPGVLEQVEQDDTLLPGEEVQ
ncbi:MAG: DUF389 domain-containing protein [Spirochaetales bacterium]|nr:DUF389 domain-containing protein [Spirochaetales bacterium]